MSKEIFICPCGCGTKTSYQEIFEKIFNVLGGLISEKESKVENSENENNFSKVVDQINVLSGHIIELEKRIQTMEEKK